MCSSAWFNGMSCFPLLHKKIICSGTFQISTQVIQPNSQKWYFLKDQFCRIVICDSWHVLLTIMIIHDLNVKLFIGCFWMKAYIIYHIWCIFIFLVLNELVELMIKWLTGASQTEGCISQQPCHQNLLKDISTWRILGRQSSLCVLPSACFEGCIRCTIHILQLSKIFALISIHKKRLKRMSSELVRFQFH